MRKPVILILICIINIVILSFFPAHKAYSFSDQTTTERILRENKDFVEFINVAVTNFADDKKEQLKSAYEKHFNGEVAYLQSDYRRAFKRFYTSQGEMVKLYEEIVRDHYLDASKTILDTLATGIIMSKNSRARLYLTLGYRDRTVSWTHYTIGDASTPKLYSYKLYKYVEAIKMARRAKRYAFLALFESQTPEVKLKIYNNLLKQEKEAGNLFYNRFIDLDEKGIIAELGKSYDDYEKELEKSRTEKTDDKTFDQKLARRVRYRNDVRTARYMLNNEFDKAEDIMRKYVDDFNFKLTMSTFNLLNQAGASPESKEGGAGAGKNIDYNLYKIHLLDNYLRLSKKSALEEMLDSVRVEDDVKPQEPGAETTEESGSGSGKAASDGEKTNGSAEKNKGEEKAK